MEYIDQYSVPPNLNALDIGRQGADLRHGSDWSRGGHVIQDGGRACAKEIPSCAGISFCACASTILDYVTSSRPIRAVAYIRAISLSYPVIYL
ncbi:hypothetical protein J6590_099541 [Homalodisca vitripennis]|nr:hypothetical protein J6590_099541 [Homalodisca vitripennis]